MILKLSIKNYILIEKLDVNFKEGFSSITGETGAGKSIILGALNLISGARVDHQIVGSKNEKCIVEGEFLISETLADFFDYQDLDFDDHTILRREILLNGKCGTIYNNGYKNLAYEIQKYLKNPDIFYKKTKLAKKMFRNLIL